MKKEMTDTQQSVSEYPGNDDHIGIKICYSTNFGPHYNIYM